MIAKFDLLSIAETVYFQNILFQVLITARKGGNDLNLNWKKNKNMYMGIGICLLGAVLMMQSINTMKNVSQKDQLASLYPIKKGVEVVEKTAEEQEKFSVVTNDLGENFNPLYASTRGEKIIQELIFEPLALRDANGFYENVLAEEIDYNEAEQTLVITIKEGVQFSDGTPLTIQDVEQSILLAMYGSAKGTKYITEGNNFISNPSLRPVGIQILDDLTIQISFIRYEIENLLVLEIPIQKVPYLQWNKEEFDSYLKGIVGYGVGTGSYMLDSRNDYQVRLVANELYRYDIKDIKFIDVYDEYALDLRMEFQEGTVDYTLVDYNSEASDLVYEKDNLDIFGKEYGQTIGLYMNHDSVMGNNEIVRLVLQNVIDRELLFTGAYENKVIPVTSILNDILLPNKEPKDMIDLDFVNTIFVTLNQDIEQQKSNDQKAAKAETEAETATATVVEAEAETATATEVTTETESSEIEEMPISTPQPTEELAEEKLLLLTEDGKMKISILLMEGNDLYIGIGEELKKQLEKYKFYVELDVVSQNEYLDALYGTGNYDFYIGSMKEITEIYDFELLFDEYSWESEEEVRSLMENLVISESDAEKQDAATRLTTLIEKNFMFLPLGKIQNFAVVSTYWRDYVITPTSFAPQQLYNVSKRD